MPATEHHFNQAVRNIQFLSNINDNIDDCIDWQVTVCFYSALHLVNAHLAKYNAQYRKHVDVDNAINPLNVASLTKIDEDTYFAYNSLQSLSRRSRYLINNKDIKNNKERNRTEAAFTYSKHLAKAVRHLDTIIHYFALAYKYEIGIIHINCENLKYNDLKYFECK